jgi:hypothetical protein
LSSYQGYDQGDDDTEKLLGGRSQPQSKLPLNSQEGDFQSIKAAISALKPYLARKAREGSNVVQIQELFPSGESGYKKSVTIIELLKIIKKEVDTVEKAERTSLKSITIASAASESQERQPRLPHHGIREIRLHDLRSLEEAFSAHEEPIVLIRRHVVIMSLSPVRVIITADKVILVVPNGADSLLYLLHDHMNDVVEMSRSGIHMESFTAESRVYEAVLSTLHALHLQEYLNISASAEDILRDFRQNSRITLLLQDRIRALKTAINSKSIKVDSYCKLLGNLLERDDDLAMMNLTMLKHNPELYQ